MAKERKEEEAPPGIAPLRPLKEHYSPSKYASPSCIQLPTIQAAQYEIKPSIIILIPSFYGLNNEDPYNHIDDFLLKDKAKYWLSTLPANSITTWAQLQQKFLDKYFSVGKTNQYRRSITSFAQTDSEQFHEAWDRFKDLIRKCPHHLIAKWQLVQFFYDGLSPKWRNMVVTTSGGSFMLKNEDEEWELFKNLSETFQHHTSAARLERPAASNLQKPRGMFEIQPSNELTTQVAALIQKLDQLLSVGQSLQSPSTQGVGALCSSLAHFVSDCPAAPQFPEFVQEQVNAVHKGFSKPGNDHFSNIYNPGWSNHPNFSWKSPGQGTSYSQPLRQNSLINLAVYHSQ
ncbi:hypothetical protein CKAN_02239100 [Cinnamomum micranthum f. kanehirae]|uniref:Retrotransposon gag domain-containing protein n=1 Tax=Cinnamomum micranthum f. kanehirae TaxID=337451 RepID=A0A3S3NDU8_9MAGN|nr:hypothetical protein CKAN_02239100 [Cinnamomum micranthum f. kanehirae]